MRREGVAVAVVLLLVAGLAATWLFLPDAGSGGEPEGRPEPPPDLLEAPPPRVSRDRLREPPAPEPAAEVVPDAGDDPLGHLSDELPDEEAALPIRERVMRGEALFDAGDPEGAWPYYLSVVQGDPEDPLAAFALYKLAWIEWNLGDPEGAMADLELAVEWLEDNGDRQSWFLSRAVQEDIDTLIAEHPQLAE